MLAEPLPVVLGGHKVTKGEHARHHADEVAHRHVQNPAIPPAFVKVGQHVGKGELHELKANGERPQHGVIAHDERLAPPAQRVCDDKLVKQRCRQGIPVDALARDVEAAVASIGTFVQGDTQFGVEVLCGFQCGFQYISYCNHSLTP